MRLGKPATEIPLRFFLIVSFLLQTLTAVGLVGYLSLRNGQRAIDSLANELMSEAGQAIEQHLDTYLATPQHINRINASAAELGLLDLQDFEATGQYFWQQIQTFDVSYIGYSLATGEFAGAGYFYDTENASTDEVSEDTNWLGYTYSTDDRGNRVDVIGIDPYKPHTEAWYRNTVAAQKPVWSQVYSWDNFPEIIAVSVTQPLYDAADNVVAVLYTDLLLSQISQFLQTVDISPSTKVFVIERSGLMIANSEAEPMFRPTDGGVERLSALESRDRLTQLTAQHLQTQFGDFRNVEGEQSLRIALRNPESSARQRHLVQVIPWQDALGLDWLVVIAVPEQDFVGQIQANTRTTVLLCLATLAGAIAIGLLSTRWIANPIAKLTYASQAIASGELDQTVTSRGISELRILAISFNQMAAQLRQSFSQLSETNEMLEQRVARRTSQLHEAKEAADGANQAKSDFLARVSHELRTPLNGILGYAQILGRDSAATLRQTEGLNVIRQCGQHLLMLINDILDISKIEARKLELQPQAFPFPLFLESIVQLCRLKAKVQSIEFVYCADSELPAGIYADEVRLRQVLINILNNAVKFTERGSVTFTVSVLDRLSVDAQTQDEPLETSVILRFQVDDTGIGIASEQLERIFLPFEQLDRSTRPQDGTGLGLAISQRLLQHMGSEIEVVSTPSKGSRFWFDLTVPETPNLARASSDLRRPSPIGYSGERRRILVIDDRWENRSVVRHLLQPLGFEVLESDLTAAEFEQAIAINRAAPPHLVILDPTRSVDEAAQVLALFKTATAVIIASSTSTSAIDNPGQYDGFLLKPIRSEELLELLRQKLELTWQYSDPIQPRTPSRLSYASRYPVPPADELALLHQAACVGDIRAVAQEALRLEQTDAIYGPFAQHLLSLVDSLDEQGILTLLKQDKLKQHNKSKLDI
ncbi:MAG: ATP-binding protein [Elainellaceae cyanobacterium]